MGNKKKRNTAGKWAQRSLVQENPKLAVIIMVILYFTADYMMMDGGGTAEMGVITFFTMLAPAMLYSFYVADYHRGLAPKGGTDVPKVIKNRKLYVTVGWAVILLLGVVFLMAEPVIVPRFFPVLDEKYQQSQIMLMIFIAPVMEEVTFRYLLYDRWLKRKLGWLGGFLVASFIFVLCHPVTNMHSLVVYWVPTALFFLIYHEFGLYGSIVMHMIYNMMAI